MKNTDTADTLNSSTQQDAPWRASGRRDAQNGAKSVAPELQHRINEQRQGACLPPRSQLVFLLNYQSAKNFRTSSLSSKESTCNCA